MRTRNVVDVAAVVFVVTDETKRHTIAQGNVNETFREVAKVARLRLPHAEAETALKFLSARCVGHNLNCA